MSPRPLDALIDQADPMWPLLQQWIAESPRPVEVLPGERDVAAATLTTLQVTTHSTLGALAWETGGILLNYGWLRILGAASDRMRDGLLAWNGLATDSVPDLIPHAFMVAHDVAGGFFAMDGGAFGTTARQVHYFAPGTLKWENLALAFTDFVHWALTGDLDKFYADIRWPGWEQEVAQMTGDQGFSFWPMLWSAEGKSPERSRRVVPQCEVWKLQQGIARQVTDLPPGTPIRIRFEK